MKVAFLTGPRPARPMGMELAEQRLLAALHALPGGPTVEHRVVGGRAARASAGAAGARWIPSRGGVTPGYATRGADLVHLAGLELRPPRRGRFVVTVYDLAPLRFHDEGSLPPWAAESVERAELVLCPSRFAASELHELLGVPEEKLRVVGCGTGLDPVQAEPLGENELRELGIAPPFVLRCGGYTARKNVGLLLEAWQLVEAEATLVLAGPPQAARNDLAGLLDGQIVLLDYAPAELLERLFRTAAALVSTSLYEGFGMPVLEALTAGTPVVATRTPFTEEVAGDAAFLVDAEPAAIAGALERALAGDRPQGDGRSRAASFTWARTANAVAEAYAAVTA
ncbi:MAG: glycosyltransferase family 4 protein [Gaiellaceae bacterium]